MPSDPSGRMQDDSAAPAGERTKLTARAQALRQRWQAALPQAGSLPEGLAADSLATQVTTAGREMVSRVAVALLQEGILRPELQPDGTARVVIPGAAGEAGVVLLEGLDESAPSLFPDLRLLHQDAAGPARPVEDPAALLEAIAPLLPGAALRDLLRLVEELTDSQLNQALCDSYRAAWNARLREKLRTAGAASFWAWLADQPAPAAQAVTLEQWSATGHPYHPTHKTRIGMTPAEVLGFCPEFEPQLQAGLVAARRGRIGGDSLTGAAGCETWLQRHFPETATEWQQALRDRGLAPDDYVPLPAHPWQLAHEIPKRFARSIERGDLVLLAAPTIPVAPLVSVRTLVPTADVAAPHLKLSLGVRLTSVERTISPRSCDMGPRVSRLLEELIDHDEALSSTLGILPEEAGLYFAASDSEERDQGRHLAAVLRRSPSLCCGSDEVIVPTTALSVATPLSGAPLFLELLPPAERDSPQAVRDRFAHYAEALLRPILTFYLRYGIGLEAHQQNVVALYDHSGALRRFLLRDFGGIRIHEPSLRAAGLELELHPDRLTVVEDRDEVCSKVTSRTFHYHVGFLISRLCRHLRTGEAPFWADVAEIVQAIFDDLQGPVDAATWRRERTALLDKDWCYKCSLRMRLEGLAGDVYQPGPNPLRWGR